MFHLIINDQEPVAYEKIQDALWAIGEAMAAWNNFEDHKKFRVSILKIKDRGALGVQVAETVQAADIFGKG